MPTKREVERWEALRRRLVSEVSAGRLSGREAMDRLGATSSMLGGWVRAERVRRAREAGPAAVSAFVPVSVASEGASRERIEVVLRCGRRLRVSRGTAPEEIARLVRAIEAAC